MKLLRSITIAFALLIATSGAFASVTTIISYCGYENTLGCGCDQGTLVPFADGTASWCVYWDREADGVDDSDEAICVHDTDPGCANYACAPVNGEAICGIAGNFAAETALVIRNLPEPPDQPVYFIKVSGQTCCWVSDTFRLADGLSDVNLPDGAFHCVSAACPTGVAPTPPTNVAVSDDQFCSEVSVTWEHSGENVSSFLVSWYNEETQSWVLAQSVSGVDSQLIVPVCIDGEVQISVQSVSGTQVSDRVTAVGRTFLRHFDAAQPIQVEPDGDVLIRLTKPPQGQSCDAFLYFDLYSGGTFLQRLCEVIGTDQLTLLEVTCTLPATVPNPSCSIVMRDSAASPILNGCVLTDTVVFDYHTDASDNPELPREFALKQNYPNPFNPSTMIEFAVPAEGNVELSIYNLVGQKVATLVNGKVAQGQHIVEWNARAAATGMYFYRLQMGNQVMTRKMLLLK